MCQVVLQVNVTIRNVMELEDPTPWVIDWNVGGEGGYFSNTI